MMVVALVVTTEVWLIVIIITVMVQMATIMCYKGMQEIGVDQVLINLRYQLVHKVKVGENAKINIEEKTSLKNMSVIVL